MGYSVFGLLYYCCKNHHYFTLDFSKTSLEGVYCMTVPQREMIYKSSTFHRYDKKKRDWQGEKGRNCPFLGVNDEKGEHFGVLRNDLPLLFGIVWDKKAGANKGENDNLETRTPHSTRTATEEVLARNSGA